MSAHVWRGIIEEYRSHLPVSEQTPVITLREGGTPLVRANRVSEMTGCEVYLKVEGANPTGSFKDRGMTTAISQVLQSDTKVVACASTGNTSASAAAYAVAAGLQSAVILPAGKIAAGKLAQAIVREAQSRGLAIPTATAQRALVGSGIEATVDGKKVLIVAAGKSSHPEVEALEQTGQTVVTLMQDGVSKGMLALRDTLRDDAKEAVAALHKLGVQGIILTGDNPRAAAAIAGELGLEFKAGLLPADKVSAVTELNARGPLAMVGDGINDAPAMKASTIGIAMGSGTDVALETADAALTHNRLTGLAQMIGLARATRANIRQNITIALGLKGIFLVTTLLGMTGLWLAVLADTGATVLVTLNALRLLRFDPDRV